jgi:RNA polymerase sigma-70 factor (sigma-E family)
VDTVIDAGVDFDALYAGLWHSLVRLAVLLVDDRATAEDVVQDAFLALHARSLRQPEAAGAYLRTSVINGARSVLRRRGTARRNLPALTPLGHGESSPDDLLVAAAEHADVIRALRALPPRQREVLVLRYWAGLSESEIARTLGVSAGTVKSSVSRGLDALEQWLGGAQ